MYNLWLVSCSFLLSRKMLSDIFCLSSSMQLGKSYYRYFQVQCVKDTTIYFIQLSSNIQIAHFGTELIDYNYNFNSFLKASLLSLKHLKMFHHREESGSGCPPHVLLLGRDWRASCSQTPFLGELSSKIDSIATRSLTQRWGNATIEKKLLRRSHTHSVWQENLLFRKRLFAVRASPPWQTRGNRS